MTRINELLCDAWMATSQDPITNAQQTRVSYWIRIHKDFKKTKSYPPHDEVYIDRNVKAIKNWWGDNPQV